MTVPSNHNHICMFQFNKTIFSLLNITFVLGMSFVLKCL